MNKISLIHTPEVPADFVDSVVAFFCEHARWVKLRRLETIDPHHVHKTLVQQGAVIDGAWLDWRATVEVLEGLQSNSIEDELLMLLTDIPNAQNFFSFGERGLYCIHTAGWNMFIPGDRRIPVAHQIASNFLLDIAFGSMDRAAACAHVEPRGCLLDLCMNKSEVHLKMRTADTCTECMGLFDGLIADGKLVPHVLHELWGIFDAVRSQILHRERLRIAAKTSPIEIRDATCRIWLTDYETELKLRPQEHALYLFFLRHRKRAPIAFHDLDVHVDELAEWHAVISGSRDIEDLRLAFSEIVNPLAQRVSEKISKIRRKLADIVGEENVHRYLWSSTERGPRRIHPDLEVTWEQDAPTIAMKP